MHGTAHGQRCSNFNCIASAGNFYWLLAMTGYSKRSQSNDRVEKLFCQPNNCVKMKRLLLRCHTENASKKRKITNDEEQILRGNARDERVFHEPVSMFSFSSRLDFDLTIDEQKKGYQQGKQTNHVTRQE